MNVIFRVDASTIIGTGHLIRCLALTNVLRKKGVSVRFVTREHPGNLIALLRQRDIPVSVLPYTETAHEVSANVYAEWLGVLQYEDARQTINAIAADMPDWLIVDHYALDAEWEREVRPFTRRILVIDDLANRAHECDLLFDQSYAEEKSLRYGDLVDESTKMLLGPDYALLGEIYAQYRNRQRPRDGVVERVQVYFGGADLHGLTVLVLQALSLPALEHLHVEIVIGVNYGDRTLLDCMANARPRTSILTGLPHLADSMTNADLAIGAGGTTIWERMCLGLPSIVISVAENQRPGAEALAKQGFLEYAGHYDRIKLEGLTDLIMRVCSKPSALAEASRLGQLQVDGLGAHKLAELLFPSNKEKISLRPAREGDIFHYFRWANDPTVRAYAHSSAPILWETHKNWFASKINSTSSWLFVMEIDGIPFGQIRFDRIEGELVIGYSLESILRGRGLGVHMVAAGVQKVSQYNELPLRADVFTTNAASLRIFRKLDFVEQDGESEKYLTFRKQTSGMAMAHDRDIQGV